MNYAEMRIRLSQELRAKIETAKKQNKRTMNGEIVTRLERTFLEDAEREKGGLKFVAAAQRLNAEAVDLMPRQLVEERFTAIERRLKKLERKK